jgi:hypothetical protein
MANQPLTTKADETPEFVLFWEQWRRFARKNDGRGEARDTFVKHIKAGADGSDIADGATWYLNNLTERDKEYIPLASTWINRRAYEDMAEQHRSHMAVIEERRARRAQEQSTNVVSIDPDRRADMAAKARALVGGVKLQEA